MFYDQKLYHFAAFNPDQLLLALFFIILLKHAVFDIKQWSTFSVFA